MKITTTILSFFLCFSAFSQTWWIQDYLPTMRVQFSTVSLGDTMLLVGGNGGGGVGLLSSVDTYIMNGDYFDVNYNLSSPRCFVEPVVGDSAIYAVGGSVGFPNWPASVDGSPVVDIYKNGVWSTHLLPDTIVRCSVVKVGTKILITGLLKDVQNGTPVHSDVVHIYDESTDIWSTAMLSESRALIGAAANDSLAVFAGGWNGYNSVSNVVDIYNSNTNTWTTATISQARCASSGAFGGGKFMFAGGAMSDINSSDVVDIFDGTNWTTDNISQARTGIRSVVTPNRIVFIGGGDMNLTSWTYTNGSASNVADAFRFSNQNWSTSFLNGGKLNHAVGSYGEVVYALGGLNESLTSSNSIERVDFEAGLSSLENNPINVYPNPTQLILNIDLPQNLEVKSIRITDVSGKEVTPFVQISDMQINTSSLKDGNYFVTVISNEMTYSSEFIIKH